MITSRTASWRRRQKRTRELREIEYLGVYACTDPRSALAVGAARRGFATAIVWYAGSDGVPLPMDEEVTLPVGID